MLLDTVHMLGWRAEAPILRLLSDRYDRFAATSPDAPSFELRLPDQSPTRFGPGSSQFAVVIRSERGRGALLSLDQNRLLEAYMDGDLDIQGELLPAFGLRSLFTDVHPVERIWTTFAQPLLYGQLNRDRKWIAEHYDLESDFFLLFLDSQYHCYTHGHFRSPEETLETAMEHKLEHAFEACRLQPGWRVLDIGAGWGAFIRFAGRRGVDVTSLTISAESERFVRALIDREGLPGRVVGEHFLEHVAEPYDAIINLGVTEHLPDYDASMARYQRLLRPGGILYLDACASRTKFPFSTFIRTHVWPGNTSPLCLHDYLASLERTPLELLAVGNHRVDYQLTCRRWAENLERNRDEIARRWGERLFRRFQLYLWGATDAFARDILGAYHLVIQRPAGR